MTDHKNELTIGTGQDGKPVTVLVIHEEFNRFWENENTQSGHGKSSLSPALMEKVRELVAAGRSVRAFDVKASDFGRQRLGVGPDEPGEHIHEDAE